MKRIIIISLAFIMLFAINACSGVENETASGEEPKQYIQQEKPEVESPVQKDEVVKHDGTEGYSNVAKAVDREIYINYSDEKIMYKESSGDYFRNMDASFTAFIFNIFEEEETLEEVLDNIMPGVLFNGNSYSEGWIVDAEYEIISSEKVTIAGYDSFKITGIIKNEDGWDCHLYGYTFLFDKTPVAVLGLVSHAEQDPELIASVDKEVDTMVQTIRTEK